MQVLRWWEWSAKGQHTQVLLVKQVTHSEKVLGWWPSRVRRRGECALSRWKELKFPQEEQRLNYKSKK